MSLISIIIPIYNCERHLVAMLNSLQDQTYRRFEALMIDDGSTDSSSEICKRFSKEDSRFKYYYKKNGGAASARNYGINIASGDYLMFLDGDDLFEKTYLEKMSSIMTNPEIDVCQCGADVFSDNGRSTSLFAAHCRRPAGVYSVSTITDDFYQRVTTVPWDKLFRRSLIIDNGLQFQDLKYSNDNYFVLMSLSCANKIAYLDDIMVHYRVSEGSSLRDSMYKNPLCDLLMIDKLREDFYLRNSNINEVSLDTFCLDTVFKSMIFLSAQSESALTSFIQEYKSNYFEKWISQNPSFPLVRSMKERVKGWLIQHSSVSGLSWAILPYKDGKIRSMGAKDNLFLLTRMIIATTVK